MKRLRALVIHSIVRALGPPIPVTQEELERVDTVTGSPSQEDEEAEERVPEDKNRGDTVKTLPVVPEHTRPGPRESAFMKWGPPPRTPSLTPDGSRPGDSVEFHSGEEQETSSPEDKEVCPLTIEHGDKQIDTPLHSVSWKDESHPNVGKSQHRHGLRGGRQCGSAYTSPPG